MKPIEGLSFIVIAVGYPESATVRKQNIVLQRVFGAAFFKKGQFQSARPYDSAISARIWAVKIRRNIVSG